MNLFAANPDASICEDHISRKAFYDPGANQSDFAFNLVN